MILISACLAGLNVRYNGTNSLDEKIQKLVLEKSCHGLPRADGRLFDAS